MPASTSCELCSGDLQLFTQAKARTPATWRCGKCGLVQVRLNDEEAEAWRHAYRAGGYYRRRVLADHDTSIARHDHDLRIARVRLENMRRHINPGRLLDVGASSGAFVQAAAGYGFTAFGLEPDPDAFKAGRTLAGIRLLPLTFEEAAPFAGKRSFRAVTFHDSFEHLLNPHNVLAATHDLLYGTGLLVLEMPDADCPAFAEQGIGWRHFKPREHAYLYGRQHVESLLDDRRFELIDTIVPYPDRRTYYARPR